MPISFASIPSEIRQPLWWLEVDPSQAGLPVQRMPLLMVGQMLASGAGVPDVPIPVGTLAEAKHLFGEGSELERMIAVCVKNNFLQETWALPMAPLAEGAVAAHETITVSHAPTAAGQISLYVGAAKVTVGVNASDTVGDVAVSIADAINAIPTMPVVATVESTSSGTVTVTCKWKGITGNSIRISDSFYGSRGSEVLPLGLALTYGNANGMLESGVGEPDFSTAIANLGDEPYEYVALPYDDSGSWLAWDAEYGFSDTGRWGWMRQLYGHIFTAHRGIYSDLMEYGLTNNSGVISVMGCEATMLSPTYEIAAAYASKSGRALQNDPARPLQTLALDGCLPAPKHDRFPMNERNALAGVGVATQAVAPSGIIQIMRESTSYQLNLYGMSDDSYELVTTLATLAKLFRNQKAAITSKYPRHKLADDGTRFGAGQAIVTPSIIKAELIAEYGIDQFNGLVENTAAFKANLIVERDSNNPNRVNVLYPPDLINQLRIFAVLAQFRLQYDRGVDSAIAA